MLVDELARCFMEHRRECEACQPGICPTVIEWLEHKRSCYACRNGFKVATERYGEPCPRYAAHIQHGNTCKRCNPCPALRTAIEVVLEWRRHRELLSRAESLRLDQSLVNQLPRNAAA